MLQIDKKSFCRSLDSIKTHYKYLDRFNSIMSEFNDTYYRCTLGDKLLESYISLLANLSKCSVSDVYGDDISWWLFESVDKVITVDSKPIDVTTAESFYDFLEMMDTRDEK